MASKMIGIEIGSAALKLSLVRGGRIQAMASARIPSGLVVDGRVTDPAAMTALLKTVLAENCIRRGPCALVLPRQAVAAQRITLPVMSEAALKLNLPFEFRDYVGADAGEYDYDYIVNGIRDGVMDLYAAAVRRSLVEEYWSIFKTAGLPLKTAIPGEMAWLNLISRCKSAPEKLAIADIGHDAARLHIFAGGNFVMGKEIDRGASAAEIRKAVNFYNFSIPAGEAPLQTLCVCGEAALNVDGFTHYPIHHLLNLDASDSMAAICALSAGAALQDP